MFVKSSCSSHVHHITQETLLGVGGGAGPHGSLRFGGLCHLAWSAGSRRAHVARSGDRDSWMPYAGDTRWACHAVRTALSPRADRHSTSPTPQDGGARGESIPTTDSRAIQAERRQSLPKQLAIQRANLNELELQLAKFSIRKPLDLVNEHKDVKHRIEEIERELAQLGCD